MSFTCSIVIPTLGESQKLSRLLRSIREQSQFTNIEVLIVENSARQDAVKILTHELGSLESSFRIIKSENLGVNFARNLGLREARAAIVFFVDDDCWMHDAKLVEKHVQMHRQFPEVFAFGGTYLLDERGSGFMDRCYHANQMRWLQRGTYGMEGNQSRYLIGGHFSIKREIAVGKKLEFDEKIKYGGSELSFFLKAHQQGLGMQLEALSVVHQTRETLFTVIKKLFKQGRGKAYLREEIDYGDPLKETHIVSPGLLSLAAGHFMSVVFWFGFHFQRRDLRGFISQIAKTAMNRVKYQRHVWLKRAEQKIQNKVERGDRL